MLKSSIKQKKIIIKIKPLTNIKVFKTELGQTLVQLNSGMTLEMSETPFTEQSHYTKQTHIKLHGGLKKEGVQVPILSLNKDQLEVVNQYNQ